MDTQLASLDHNDPLELAAGYLTWLKAAPEPEDEVDFRPLLQVLALMVKTSGGRDWPFPARGRPK